MKEARRAGSLVGRSSEDDDDAASIELAIDRRELSTEETLAPGMARALPRYGSCGPADRRRVQVAPTPLSRSSSTPSDTPADKRVPALSRASSTPIAQPERSSFAMRPVPIERARLNMGRGTEV